MKMSDSNDIDHGKDVPVSIGTSKVILLKTVADLQECLHSVSQNLKVRLQNSRVLTIL
jgi:adenosine/AMP kinase